MFPSAFLFSLNVFSKASGELSSNCFDVLFTSVGFILPMCMHADFGL